MEYDVPEKRPQKLETPGKIESNAKNSMGFEYVLRDIDIETRTKILSLRDGLVKVDSTDAILQAILDRNDDIHDQLQAILNGDFGMVATREEKGKRWGYSFQVPRTNVFDGLHEPYIEFQDSRIGVAHGSDVTIIGIKRPSFQKLHGITRLKIGRILSALTS